jgi:hypothetical protein
MPLAGQCGFLFWAKERPRGGDLWAPRLGHRSPSRPAVMARQLSANVGLGTNRRRVTISWLAIRSASQMVFQNATPVDDRLNLRNAVGTNRARITARSRSAICSRLDVGVAATRCTRFSRVTKSLPAEASEKS